MLSNVRQDTDVEAEIIWGNLKIYSNIIIQKETYTPWQK